MEKLQKIENAGDSSNTVTLPDHLIIDHILPKLPVKTLIRFKSVSKFWLSAISSPQFVKSHLDCSSSSTSSGQFISLIEYKHEDDHCSFKLMSLPYDEMNNLKAPLDLGFPLGFEPDMNADIVGCSNGLVCLHVSRCLSIGNCRNARFLFFYVYNPATHENREIINPNGSQDLLHNWFGYVPSVDDYMIVTLFSHYDVNGRPSCIYSMRIGKWQVIDDLDENIHCYWDSLLNSKAIIDDVLYWSLQGMNIVGTDDVETSKCIVGIDLVNRQLKEFQWMDWLSKYNEADFYVLNGCLSLLCWSYSCPQICDVWALKKHGDWSSWEKSLSVNLGDMISIYSVTPTGKFMLGRPGKQFKIIDINKDTQELSQGDVYIYPEAIANALVYVESLVSPFGTIKPNEEGDHHEGYMLKKNRIHYSGLLFPAGETNEEMLQERERLIQLAVRKSRMEKANNDVGEVQLQYSNGRNGWLLTVKRTVSPRELV